MVGREESLLVHLRISKIRVYGDVTKFVPVKLGTNFPCLPRENGKTIALEISKQKN